MTGSSSQPIDKKVDRIEEIISALQNDDVSLSEAKSLYEEGEQLLAGLEDDLEIDDAEIIER